MEKIYGYDIYKRRTNNSFKQFLMDYLKITKEDESGNLDVSLDKTSEFISMVNKHKEDKIVIVGDYDVDGVSATAIMLKGLKLYGIDNVFSIIPDRFKDGYGMNVRIVDEAISLGAKLIITVDNGVRALEAVEYARSNNLDVIVTDHHLPGDVLPNSNININCHIDNNMLHTNDICGAMIAYLLIKALLNKTDDELKELLFIAQMATIADVMPIKCENKYLIRKVIKNTIEKRTTFNKGLDILFRMLRLDYINYNLETISFKIAPLLNAPGRLKHADMALKLLLGDDDLELQGLCNELIELNNFRKKELDKLKKEAISKLNPKASANVIMLEDAHEGLIGIVAGSLTELTMKPSFIFTNSESGQIKGSGRSPKWCNLAVVCEEVFKSVTPVVYGGHENAMGLTLDNREDLVHFQTYLNSMVETLPKEEELKTFLRYPNELTIKNVRDILDEIGPFGEGCSEPNFVVTTKITRANHFGAGHTKIFLNLADELVEGLYFFNNFEALDKLYNVYFKVHKEYSNYSKKIEYKAFISNIKEQKATVE